MVSWEENKWLEWHRTRKTLTNIDKLYYIISWKDIKTVWGKTGFHTLSGVVVRVTQL